MTFGPVPARTTVAAALAATLTLLAAPVASAVQPTTPHGVVLVAHRGSVDHAPEHTLAAIDQAVADHADRISLDIQMSQDGVPVVVHDFDLVRTTDVELEFPGRPTYAVNTFTLAQIKTLDAGSWYQGGIYTGSSVLTLDEALSELADSPTGLTVEVKNPASNGGVVGVGAAVRAVLDRHPEFAGTDAGGSARLVVESFDWAFLDAMHATYPDLPLVLLGGTVTAEDITAHPYVREIDVRHLSLTPQLVETAHLLGILVGTWTANTTTELQRVIDLGSDAVSSDQPARLRTMLAEQGLTWTGTNWPAAPATASVTVSAPSRAPDGGRVQVTAHPRTSAGIPVRWQTVSFQSEVGGRWRTIGSNATDSQGSAVLSLPVEDTMRIRVVSAGRVSAERIVAAVTAPVTLPVGAPAPKLRLAAQVRATTPGVDARVTPMSSTGWRAMSGRSWHRGCPVGRSGLRTLRVSYWGFDGRVHRGELVLARGSTYQIARVFRRLYAQRLPVRSLHRLESLGSWSTAVGRAMRADAGFGYACQRVPGDRGQDRGPGRFGSHARGTIVTVNPWENPALVSGRGVPDTWWLGRSRRLAYVHRPTNPVVRAFAAEGFAWNGRYGKYADFRDVR